MAELLCFSRHPYVWNDKRRYKFLATVGDEPEVATW